MNKVPLKGVGKAYGQAPQSDPPPHENVRIRVVASIVYDQEVEVESFFHPSDYKGTEAWEEFISGSISDAVGDEYDGADIQSVRRWMDDWNMLGEADETISVEWEWVDAANG